MPDRAQLPTNVVATDLVIFTVSQRSLQVLLTVRGDPPFDRQWALPGEYLGAEQGLDACARHKLEDSAGLMDVYLEQLYSFGRPNRVAGPRVVSIAYFAIVPPQYRVPYPSDGQVRWFTMHEVPTLPFDHDEIMDLAHKRLQDKLTYTTIALQFMSQQFTLGQLQSVYETILVQKLDKRNFRKRMRALDCLEETGRMSRDSSHRPARLYRAKNPGQVAIVG